MKNKYGYSEEECKVNIENIKAHIELAKISYDCGIIDKEILKRMIYEAKNELRKYMF